ncbi:MAG TPA: hypothetical protein VH593_21675 [Ktedonobacteraceae bacterium]|jgi:hypothetical protein
MHVGQTQDLGLSGAIEQTYMQQIKVLKALEQPAHSGPSRGAMQLAWHRLTSGGSLLAYAHFGQLVDEQAEHHDQCERHDTLWLFHEDRRRQKQGAFEKRKPAFHYHLFLIQRDDRLCGDQQVETGEQAFLPDRREKGRSQTSEDTRPF